MGKPSIFVRLTGCNLLCGNPKGSIKGKTQAEIDAMQGDNATWTCDSIAVWRDGEKDTVQKISDEISLMYQDEIRAGAQIIVTGGEPLIQDEGVYKLSKKLKDKFPNPPRFEVETNGTKLPLEYLYQPFYAPVINQFNVSPKLANSGMPEDRRIKPKALNKFSMLARKGMAIFKFVVTEDSDIDEIKRDFIKPFQLPQDKIYLMPGCSNRKQFEEVSPLVAKICQLEGYNFSSRLQINLWNQVTGV